MNSVPRAVPFTFPAWANLLLPGLVVLGLGVATYLPVVVGLGGSPLTTDVGYAPEQPVAFSHAVHAGQLGMDCRYCHTTVEKAAFAAIPPTQTCMNCHAKILPDSPEIIKVRESAVSGRPIPWVKVHNLPDYSYFDHSAHVNRGIGCVSCHGRVDRMEVVYQFAELSMGWCLECHRNPEPHLRPLEEITNMSWMPPEGALATPGASLAERYSLRDEAYLTSCSRCHR